MLRGDLISEYAVFWMLFYLVCTAMSISWLVRLYQRKKMSGLPVVGMVMLVLVLGLPFLGVWLWYLAVSLAY